MRIVSLFLVLLLSQNCKGCKEEEREALVQIKSSKNSGEVSAFSTWYGEDCCQWEGVECNVSTSRVIRISFSSEVPWEVDYSKAWYPDATLFTQFEDLQELLLPRNQIGGFVSPNAFHELKHLQKLNLRNNQIANGSQPCWGNIPTLFSLDLSVNELQGHIPQCLCESKSLTKIILSYNQLEGNIDTCLSNMTSLRILILSNNHFTGRFPSLLFHNLTNIQSFMISHNNFTDVIPFSLFANLSELSYLDISFNPKLEIETESSTWSPSFSLRHLKLGNCDLNKRSGRNIPSFLSTQYRLESLDLSYNSLVGSFPSWLLYNISSELRIMGNNLSGSFPRSQRNMSSQLATLDISYNMLYGPFPADVNLIFPNLQLLNASNNRFNSIISRSFAEMRQLQYLDLSMNNLQGEIPQDMLRNLTSLKFLDLSNNHFQGKLLARNFSLPNLRRLFLDRNGFTGSFPDSLSKSSTLEVLSISHNDFSGELSTSFPVLPQLKVLILRWNHFEGSIPMQLCQMKNMFLFDLSENDFSGQIPICLDNITSLKERDSWVSHDFLVEENTLMNFEHYVSGIDMSSNKLIGIIPIQMTELRGIQLMNMSNNFLTGQIPESLSNLNQLEAIDLSYNKLSGYMPQNLTTMSFLSVFDVSFNNLSGPLPQPVAQFATFESSSYEGNPNLCGRPLEKICDQQPVYREKSQGEINEKTWTEIIAGLALTMFYTFSFFC